MVTLTLFGAGIILAYLLGYTCGKTQVKAPEPASAPQSPKCGCGHSVGFHKDMAGGCNAQVAGPAPGYTYKQADGGIIAKTCLCLCYDGPEPLPRSWVPPTEI